ncbi:MAG: hypothetical protein EOO10_22145 [Chitinophagaceae bacterium]|nr:MAG: hypothetical protein EOO10_22145 [Chitinophagaceae bacterium]
MKAITPSQRLKMDIARLELKRADDWHNITEEIEHIKQSFNPIHLIKSLFGGGTEAGEALKSGIGNAAVGLGSGYLLKKLLFNGVTSHPLLKVAGMAFQTVASGYIAKNTDTIKSVGEKVFGFLKSKFSK